MAAVTHQQQELAGESDFLEENDICERKVMFIVYNCNEAAQ